MYFGVKAWGFQGFFILVLLRVGQVQKTELSSHLKTLMLPVGGNVHSFLASLVILVPRGTQILVLFWVFI